MVVPPGVSSPGAGPCIAHPYAAPTTTGGSDVARRRGEHSATASVSMANKQAVLCCVGLQPVTDSPVSAPPSFPPSPLCFPHPPTQASPSPRPCGGAAGHTRCGTNGRWPPPPPPPSTTCRAGHTMWGCERGRGWHLEGGGVWSFDVCGLDVIQRGRGRGVGRGGCERHVRRHHGQW